MLACKTIGYLKFICSFAKYNFIVFKLYNQTNENKMFYKK